MTTVSDIRVNHVLNMAGEGTRDFNCWGASQYVLKVRDTLGWIETFEMSRWLSDNTEVVKTPEVGDILALFGDHPAVGKLLIHTAVYLGDGKYLHKLGAARAEQVSLQGVLKAYKELCDAHELRRLKCD